MRIRSAFALSLLALSLGLVLEGCKNPASSSISQVMTGSIKVTLGAPSGNASKSIVPPVVGTVSSVSVTVASGSTTLTQTINGPTGTLTFAGLAAGTWNVSATAYDAAGTVIGSGSANNIPVSTTSSTNIPLAINFIGDGSSATGALNITISWPASTGVDTLSWIVQTLTGGNEGSSNAAPTLSSGTYSCTINLAPLAVGAHELFLTFSKSSTGASAGKFVEAVDIIAGQTSSCWIDGTGKVQSGALTIDQNLFFNSTATLASISFAGATMNQGYSSTVTKYYFANQPTSFSFSLAPGAAGQNISYSWGGTAGSWDAGSTAAQKSASNLAIDMTQNTTSTNNLIIAVIAPDGMTQTTYTFIFPYVAGPNALTAIANDLSGSYTLASSITIPVWDNWTPIGSASMPFNGTLNGNGNTVTYSSYLTSDNIGLFGAIGTSGTVENLNVNAGIISCGNNCALLAANNSGTIDNCSASGSIQPNNPYGYQIGGLVATNNGTIKNSHNSASVSGGGILGGVAAENVGSNGLIEYCYNTGSVTSTAGAYETGGLVGWNSIASVKYCFSSGEVTGTGQTGGLIGDSSGDGSVSNCYSTGIVNVGGSGGGLIGDQEQSTLEYCYSIGGIAGTGTVGGIIGSTTSGVGTVTDCYYDLTNNSNSDSYGGIGQFDVPMKQQLFYAGWTNFGTDWAIDGTGTINGGYPYLIYLKQNTGAYN